LTKNSPGAFCHFLRFLRISHPTSSPSYDAFFYMYSASNCV
jgi:hypothetical protein